MIIKEVVICFRSCRTRLWRRKKRKQLTRVNPVINLVDNMVKLGTLYRGQDNSPLSQRMANIHSEAQKSQVNKVLKIYVYATKSLYEDSIIRVCSV